MSGVNTKFYGLVVLLFAVALLLPAESFAAFQPIRGIDEARISRTAISPVNPRVVSIATTNRLYMCREGGEDFQRVAEFRENINHLILDDQWPEVAYVATPRGLFQVRDGSTEQIYETARREEALSILQHRRNTYLGTTRGLFKAETGEWDWEQVDSDLAVLDIEPCENRVLYAAHDGVYALCLLTDEINRLYSISPSQSYDEIEDMLEEADDEDDDIDFIEQAAEDGYTMPYAININMFDPSMIFLATNDGIYKSADGGEAWERFSLRGMGDYAVRSIAQTPQREGVFYAATDRGLFEVDIEAGEATELYAGLTTSDIRDVTAAPDGNLFLASRRGAFQSDARRVAMEVDLIDPVYLEEGPPIKEVQEAAMRYNHLHPQRVEGWFEDIDRSAWYPDFQFTYRQDEEEDVRHGSSDFWRDYYYTDPPDDYYWQVRLDWDFSEIIWNSEHRSVASTARMLQRERNDLLEEVNRIYYERRRLLRGLEAEDIDPADAAQDQLRIEELTARLDAYTGGLFSRRLREMH